MCYRAAYAAGIERLDARCRELDHLRPCLGELRGQRRRRRLRARHEDAPAKERPPFQPADLLAQRHDLADHEDHRRLQAGLDDGVLERRQCGDNRALIGASPPLHSRRWGVCGEAVVSQFLNDSG